VYRWGDHTGELELEIEAPTESAVYGEAVRAMAELLGEEQENKGDAAAREVTVEASSRPQLLADFLGELAFLAEVHGFVPTALERLTLEATGLRAAVSGRTGDPPHLVKAVTYHRLLFEAVETGWRARLVLDV
jgi:SHS2 domain-containing protein